jgi:2-polyprenyl-3-methyl-5-hydroxy-6-metoxy-1,4-benzoquinol methylase
VNSINAAKLEAFISASHYTAPCDIKKLSFIFSAIGTFADAVSKDIDGLSILEIACGAGGITLPLATLGCKVRAIDIDAQALEDLHAQLEKRELNNVAATRENALTFDDGRSYDIVIASEVFEHVTEPEKLAVNIVKRMKGESILVVTIPNGYGPWEMSRRLNPAVHLRRWTFLRRLLGKEPYIEKPGIDHCQFYTRKRLMSLFFKHSLTPVEFAKSDSLLAVFPASRNNAFWGTLDTGLADFLPYWLASGWYFVFERRAQHDMP